MKKYTPDIEKKMKTFYKNLSEKDKRHYSAIEAIKLEYGGVNYIANLFQCSRQTIYTGLKELENRTLLPLGQSRTAGGGRKNHTAKMPTVEEIFLKCD